MFVCIPAGELKMGDLVLDADTNNRQVIMREVSYIDRLGGMIRPSFYDTWSTPTFEETTLVPVVRLRF